MLWPKQLKQNSQKSPENDGDQSNEVLSELIKKVRHIEMTMRGMVQESFGGEYHSRFKGEGIDFEDFREYQPGDEVRSIDWNVTGTTARPM